MTPEQRTKLEADVGADWDDFKKYHRADAEDWERRVGTPFVTIAMRCLESNAALDAAVEQEADIVSTVLPILREALIKGLPLMMAAL